MESRAFWALWTTLSQAFWRTFQRLGRTRCSCKTRMLRSAESLEIHCRPRAEPQKGSSCPDLFRASRVTGLRLTTRNVVIEVTPRRIVFFDLVGLPAARPAFDRLLSLNRRCRIIELLEVNQLMNTVGFRKTFYGTFLVFKDAPNQIVGDAHVERPIALTSQDLNVEVFGHAQRL